MNQKIIEYIYMIFGSLCLAYAAIGFLQPNGIITGGGIGMALLLHHIFPSISLTIFIILISIPFVALGYIFFGKYYTLKTFIVVSLISFFTDFLKNSININPVTNDILLASIFSGVFVGLGIGLFIKARTSAGSTSILAEIISSRTVLKPSEILLIIDAIIILTSIFIYGDIEKSLYSILGVFIAGRIIDMMVSGRPSKKLIHIVTTNKEELKKHIKNEVEEHGTILSGIGLNEGQTKTMILISVDVSKIQILKDIVIKYDPDAFVVISEVAEFLGRGNVFGQIPNKK
jgi:uncharacterized membrane-anchored protein YitT (DUF2179 family)